MNQHLVRVFFIKGLDTYNAYNVIESLVNLAKNYNRTIILTIHQPRSNIYALFDKVILLSKGRLIYSGPCHQPAIDHFGSLGYDCPLGFNIADYLGNYFVYILVDLSMHVSKEEKENSINLSKKHGDSIFMVNNQQNLSFNQKLMKLITGFRECEISKSIKQEIATQLRESYPNMSRQDLNQLGKNQSRLNINQSNFVQGTRTGSGLINQFMILNERTCKNLIRNPSLLKTQYCLCVVAALICGALFWKLDLSLSGFQNRLGVMFFICSLFGFGSLSCIHTFSSERLIFLRERANRYYSPITYFCSKVFIINLDFL
jgi:hypothetical protein